MKRKTCYASTIVVCVGASLALSYQCAGNLVINGNFEEPSLPFAAGWALYSSGETFAGWTVDSGSVDLVRLGPVGGGSIEATRTTGAESWTAASGYQSLDLNGYQPGSIYQDLSTVPNATYYLSFAMAGNVVGGQLIVSMEFSWAGGTVDTLTFDVADHDGYNMGWTYYQYAVTAPANATGTRVRFASVLPTSGARGPALDDVFVGDSPRAGIPIEDFTPVPEPGTWAAGACALGVLAVGGLRRGPRSVRD